MSKYKPYPQYKDSGVEWLGEIPEGWIVTKIKNMLSTPVTDGPHETPEFLDEGIPFVSAEAISKGYINFNKIRGHISLEDNRKYSQKYTPALNDVYMIKSGATTGITAIVENRVDFNIWSPLAVFRSNENLQPYYLLNYLRSANFQKAVELYWTYGTQQNIGMNVLENLSIPIPSFLEQQNIATYLDKATVKIDTLIEKQTKLIELLKEKRQAVISTAVTRGLDSSVPMKDSGVEWLGEIPEGWSLKNVKYLLNNHIGIKIGPFGSSLKLDDMTNTGYKVYGQENVINRNFSIGHRFISEAKFKSMIVYKVEPDDILITMMGTIGKCIVVPKEHDKGIIDSHLIKIRTNELMLPSYFVMMIDKSNVVKTQLELNSKGSIMQGLNSSIIKSLLFPLPNITEQQQILDYLDDKTTKIDNLINKATKAIDLLKERRTALISAVVTGKIDVREVS